MMPLHYMRSCGLKRCKSAAPITISARASWREAHAALRAQMSSAAIAQLGERQTEDLKVPGSIPGLGIFAGSRHGHDRIDDCRWSLQTQTQENGFLIWDACQTTGLLCATPEYPRRVPRARASCWKMDSHLPGHLYAINVSVSHRSVFGCGERVDEKASVLKAQLSIF